MTAGEAIKILNGVKPSDSPWKKNPHLTEKQAHKIVLDHVQSLKPEFVLVPWMVRRLVQVTMLKKVKKEQAEMKTIAKVFTFASSSGSGAYETLQYDDGSTSCACPGWCRRVAADGSRSCKHTRFIDQGIAEANCVSSHDYTTQTTKQKITTTKSNGTEKENSDRKLGQRKFQLD
jgi:hypothetical protein